MEVPLREHGGVHQLMRAVALASLLFLTAPIVMLFPLSIEPGSTLRFPPTGFSLRWYAEYFSNIAWINSTVLSFEIAVYASLLATFLGTAAAIGVGRGRVPGQWAVRIVLISPMLLPTIVVAVAIYGVYSSLGLVGSKLGIAMAHGVLGIPFVMLNVGSALRGVPKDYDEAALSLGANRFHAIWLVVLPLVWRGIAAGAVFTFVISFDEVVIAKFLSSATEPTLPKRMLDGVFYDLTPLLASVSVMLVVINMLLVIIGLRLTNRNAA
jgi:ABC-type spermidine/putrescine transport system permease subunit II